ncbi:hypothetical protein GCM10011586_26750 [Silvibacterium dinghuense]|nr:hypothetical protein GCM10011586_26750 [Silvibacterium dinghuense]
MRTRCGLPDDGVSVVASIFCRETQRLRETINTIFDLHGDIMLRIQRANCGLGSLQSAEGSSRGAGGVVIAGRRNRESDGIRR